MHVQFEKKSFCINIKKTTTTYIRVLRIAKKRRMYGLVKLSQKKKNYRSHRNNKKKQTNSYANNFLISN